MTDTEQADYDRLTKKAWIIYYASAVIIATLLVLFVAQDNEERFFYGLMVIAGSYVLRPGEKRMDKQIKKFTGVSRPAKEETQSEES